MKNSLLMALLLLFFLGSCKKNEESVLKIDENQSTLNLSITNASTTLNLTSNVDWKITSDQAWCTPSDLTGDGNKGIVVSCTDNYTGSDRNAKLTIEGGGLSQSVIVKQAGGTSLFEDDFSSNVNSWGIRTDTLSYGIVNGFFNLKNTCTNTTWAFAPRLILSNTTDNFVVNIDYSRVSGTGVFGISIGGSDWNNLYRVALYKTSYYAQVRNAGVYSTLISTSSCNLNSTGNNNVRLVRLNDKCDIYVNDSKVNSFSISPFGGIIAFYLSMQTEINVDYMKVTKL